MVNIKFNVNPHTYDISMIFCKPVVKIWRNHVACVKNFVFFLSNHEFNVRDSNRANTPKVIRSADVS